MPLIKGKTPASMSHNISAEMHAGKPQKQSIAIAYNLARKAAAKKMAQGGMAKEETCHACGGMVNPKLEQSHMAQGGYAEEMNLEHPAPDWSGFRSSEEDQSGDNDEYDMLPKGYSEGGGVDEAYNPHSINDTDGDNDDLVYSPEVSAGGEDNHEDAGDEEAKRNNFLRSYLIHKRIRRG